jgi:hypothetical protein
MKASKKPDMTKKEIIDAVKKERVVKENTILVNLQNNSYFQKNNDGSYSLRKV